MWGTHYVGGTRARRSGSESPASFTMSGRQLVTHQKLTGQASDRFGNLTRVFQTARRRRVLTQSFRNVASLQNAKRVRLSIVRRNKPPGVVRHCAPTFDVPTRSRVCGGLFEGLTRRH